VQNTIVDMSYSLVSSENFFLSAYEYLWDNLLFDSLKIGLCSCYRFSNESLNLIMMMVMTMLMIENVIYKKNIMTAMNSS
jgi:hypothetical protein